MMNVVCRKCGGKGHLVRYTSCFTIPAVFTDIISAHRML
jgi:hypothetical protein